MKHKALKNFVRGNKLNMVYIKEGDILNDLTSDEILNLTDCKLVICIEGKIESSVKKFMKKVKKH